MVQIATKINEFDEDSQKILIKWFTTRSVAKSTSTTYMSYITDFCKHSKKTLFEIYVTAQEEQLNDVSKNDRELTNLILMYKYFLDNSDYAQTTKNIKMNVIYSFCRAFEFYIPHIRLKKALCEDKNYERPITKEEIRLMLHNSPLREGAFLVLQATSGMSSKEARNLTVRDLLTAINNTLGTDYNSVTDLFEHRSRITREEAYEIHLVREKVNYRYITFLSKECIQHLLDYLEFRHNSNDLKKLKYDVNELIFITNVGEAMDSRTVTAMYREMGKKVGFTSEKNTYRFWRSHNIRKYFYNIAEEIVGMEYADEWLGHVPSSVTRAYARREYRMKQAYLKCLPYLTIDEDVSVVKKKLEELEEELQRLKGNI